jgi:hypothetical protein
VITKIVSWEAHPSKGERSKLWDLPLFAGLDLGRFRHPSHLVAIAPASSCGEGRTRFVQVASVWLDGEPYTTQVAIIKGTLAEVGRGCKSCILYYDNTRSELEVLREQGLLPAGWRGITITAESKPKLAARLLLALEQQRLVLLPDERQKRSLLQVNSLLKADESGSEHGEALTSLMLALEAAKRAFSWSFLDWLLPESNMWP